MKRPAAASGGASLKRPAAASDGASLKCQAAAPEEAPKAKKPRLQRKVPPFPGKPTKPIEPIEYGSRKIYTDMKLGCWRVKMYGEKKDQKANFKTDAPKAWRKVLGIVQSR